MKDTGSDIFNCGKELFSAKGYKDTNIADITKLAGVSVGTFYNHYPSKDKLFMEIFLEENAKLKRQMMESVNLDAEPTELVKQMLAMNLAGLQANPILRQWSDPDIYTRIERLFRQEKGLDLLEFLYQDTLKLVEIWQVEGKIRKDIDSKLIMAIFTAIISIDTHKEEIGLEYFPQLLEYMAEFVMKGLTECQTYR